MMSSGGKRGGTWDGKYGDVGLLRLKFPTYRLSLRAANVGKGKSSTKRLMKPAKVTGGEWGLITSLIACGRRKPRTVASIGVGNVSASRLAGEIIGPTLN